MTCLFLTLAHFPPCLRVRLLDGQLAVAVVAVGHSLEIILPLFVFLRLAEIHN